MKKAPSAKDALNVQCPKCGETFSLDETLAGPMVAQAKAEAEAELAKARKELESKESEARQRAEDLATKEKLLADREAGIQTQINQKIAAERLKIAEEERKNIREELAPELEAEKKRVEELKKERDDARKAELALLQEKEKLEERAKDLDREILRQVEEQRKAIQEKAIKDAADDIKLKLAEKDKVIQRLKEQAEELKRKAEVGSQQLQGDVLEVDFEDQLRRNFPQDVIEPVKTGVHGADVLQHVNANMGRAAGTIMWEAKRAQNWGGDWCAKAKKDAAEAKAEIAVIVSEVVPKGICGFGAHEDVWVVQPGYALSLSAVLRTKMLETYDARQGAIGRETKRDLLYGYMIGPEFRATLMGIAEPFNEMQGELLKEKRSTQARWKRQERRIERVLSSVANLQGDLQGIAGNEMPELPGFEQTEHEDED